MEIMWKTTTTKRRLVIAAIALTGLGLVTARLTFVDPAQAKQGGSSAEGACYRQDGRPGTAWRHERREQDREGSVDVSQCG